MFVAETENKNLWRIVTYNEKILSPLPLLTEHTLFLKKSLAAFEPLFEISILYLNFFLYLCYLLLFYV